MVNIKWQKRVTLSLEKNQNLNGMLFANTATKVSILKNEHR